MNKVKKRISDFFLKFKYGTLMVLVGLVIAIFDIVSKVLTDGKSATVIDGFFSIVSSHNTGAAWSILSQHTWVLILISILFIAIILVANWFFKSKSYFYAVSLGLIVGGALCNLYDRIAYGYVRDFISLDFINFPIFNIADIAITIGAILICIFFIMLAIKEKKQKRNSEIDSKNLVVANACNEDKNDIKEEANEQATAVDVLETKKKVGSGKSQSKKSTTKKVKNENN